MDGPQGGGRCLTLGDALRPGRTGTRPFIAGARHRRDPAAGARPRTASGLPREFRPSPQAGRELATADDVSSR